MRLLSILFLCVFYISTTYAAQDRSPVELIKEHFHQAKSPSSTALKFGKTWSCTGFNASIDETTVSGFAVIFEQKGPLIEMNFKYMYSLFLSQNGNLLSGSSNDLHGTMYIRQALNGDIYGEVASEDYIPGNLDSVSVAGVSAVTYWFCPALTKI